MSLEVSETFQKVYEQVRAVANERIRQQAKEIDRLREALREIKDISAKRSSHPMSSEADYFRIASAALMGEDE